MNRYIVDTKSVQSNIEVIKEYAHGSKIYGVVKYNGYGLGISKMAQLIKDSGISAFAAGGIEEIATLRNTTLPTEEILMLSPTSSPQQIKRLIELNAILTLSSIKDAQMIEKTAKLLHTNAYVHIKIDSGMGRYGFLPNQTDDILSVYSSYPHIKPIGIYTHFAQASSASKTRRSYNQFLKVINIIESAGYSAGIRHCSSSCALFKYNDMNLDAVRIGSAILGRMAKYTSYGLTKTGFCETQIEEIKDFPKGWHIGYASLYKTKKATTCALCNIGVRNGLGHICAYGKTDIQSAAQRFIKGAIQALIGSHALYGEINDKKIYLLGKVDEGTSVFDITGMDCRCGDKIKLDINPIVIGDMNVLYI